MTPEQRLDKIEALLSQLLQSDRYTFHKGVQLFDGRNIQLGVATGTKIGTAATQKMGFYGKAPIVQPAIAAFAATQGGTYVQSDVQSIASAVNNIRSILSAAQGGLGLTA